MSFGTKHLYNEIYELENKLDEIREICIKVLQINRELPQNLKDDGYTLKSDPLANKILEVLDE